jgi:hypothetical protein
MKKLIIPIWFFFAAFLPFSSYAEYYEYVDDQGNISFTDSILNVPENQRSGASTQEQSGSQGIGNSADEDEGVRRDERHGRTPHNELSARDRKFIKKMKDAGMLDEQDEERLSPEYISYLRTMLKALYKIDENDIGKKYSYLSSPESAWAYHRQALMKGDIEAALACFMPNAAGKYRAFYEALGKNELREIATAMGPIERISQDKWSAKYRIRRRQMGQDITYYLYFVNFFDNWRIDQY